MTPEANWPADRNVDQLVRLRLAKEETARLRKMIAEIAVRSRWIALMAAILGMFMGALLLATKAGAFYRVVYLLPFAIALAAAVICQMTTVFFAHVPDVKVANQGLVVLASNREREADQRVCWLASSSSELQYKWWCFAVSIVALLFGVIALLVRFVTAV